MSKNPNPPLLRRRNPWSDCRGPDRQIVGNFGSVPFEILHCALVLLGGRSGLEGAEIATTLRLRIDFSRVQTIFARTELAYHDVGSNDVPVARRFSGLAGATGRPVDLSGCEATVIVGELDMDARELGWHSGAPERRLTSKLFCFSGVAPPLICSGVEAGPGATPLTLIPFEANCLAGDLKKFMVAALVCA
jgi:hypothetical protein